MPAVVLRCPTCRRAVPPRARNESYPFCSERCRFVDLGKWLGEEYRVVDRAGEAEEEGMTGLPPDDPSGDTP